MNIRKLKISEHGKTRKLYERVFSDDSPQFTDYYYAYKAKTNEIYVAEEAEEICAMLHLNPCSVCFCPGLKNISYIVAVATREEYRHRGLMRRLLQAALRALYEKKDPFVFLMPASEAIYKPFGFRSTWPWLWEEDVMLEENQENPGDGSAKDRGMRKSGVPELFREEILQELSDRVNEKLERRFDLFSWRSPQYYRNLMAEQAASGGKLELIFRGDRPLSACCSAKEKFPPMMARIVHLERFMEAVKVREEQRFFWEVTDAVLPENSGVFEIELTRERKDIRRIAPEERMKKNSCPEKVDISEIPGRLGVNNPFLNAMICEVV